MDKIFVDNLEPNIALVVKTLKDIADKQESNSDIVSLLEKLEQKDSQAVVEAIKSIPATESVSVKEAKDILDTLATLNSAINAIKLDKVSINEAKLLLDGLSGIEKAVKAKDLSVNIDTSTIESGLSEIVMAVKAIEYPEFALPEAQIEALKPYEDYATREGQEEIVGAIKKIKINVSGGGGGIQIKDPTYNFIQSEADATHKYYGFASSTGWQFKRKELSTGIWTVAYGTGDYDTNFSDKENKLFNYF